MLVYSTEFSFIDVAHASYIKHLFGAQTKRNSVKKKPAISLVNAYGKGIISQDSFTLSAQALYPWCRSSLTQDYQAEHEFMTHE